MLGVTDLAKTYGRATTALDGVTVSWGDGLHCVAGPNGSGKTTLLRVLAGLTRPNAGKVTAPASVGVAFQAPNVYDGLTVAENLDVFGSLADAGGGDDSVDGEWRERVVGDLGLAPVRDRRAAALSGGYRRKLDLALALQKRPDALLLDEPLADLDPGTRRSLVDAAASYAAAGHSVVVSTHHVAAFTDVCETLTVLADGHVATRWHRERGSGGGDHDNDNGSVADDPVEAYERAVDGDPAAGAAGDSGRGNGF